MHSSDTDPAAMARGLSNSCWPGCSHEHCGPSSECEEAIRSLVHGTGLDNPLLIRLGLVAPAYRTNRRGDEKFCGRRTPLGFAVARCLQEYEHGD